MVTEPEYKTGNVRQATAEARQSEKQTSTYNDSSPDNTKHDLDRTFPQTDRDTQEVSSEGKTIDNMSMSSDSTSRDEPVCLCVFCRLEDPSRTLEQRSGQYLTDERYTENLM